MEALRSHYLGESFQRGPKATECLQQIENSTINVVNSRDDVMTCLQRDCIGFITSIVSNLVARFPSTQQKIVEAAKIFDSRNLHEGVKLSSYVEDELDKLGIH